MSQYSGCFQGADETLVLFDPHVFEIKKMDVPSKETVYSRIQTGEVFNSATELHKRVQELRHQTDKPTVLLLMSSGNFGGQVF